MRGFTFPPLTNPNLKQTTPVYLSASTDYITSNSFKSPSINSNSETDSLLLQYPFILQLNITEKQRRSMLSRILRNKKVAKAKNLETELRNIDLDGGDGKREVKGKRNVVVRFQDGSKPGDSVGGVEVELNTSEWTKQSLIDTPAVDTKDLEVDHDALDEFSVQIELESNVDNETTKTDERNSRWNRPGIRTSRFRSKREESREKRSMH
ncbi:hypothetical protein HK098_004049 [Nowakowskiella sp. JEL0407]|nr:hypothetical protein HK098_004049 [Nowakowskiella sp. JEL0407]